MKKRIIGALLAALMVLGAIPFPPAYAHGSSTAVQQRGSSLVETQAANDLLECVPELDADELEHINLDVIEPEITDEALDMESTQRTTKPADPALETEVLSQEEETDTALPDEEQKLPEPTAQADIRPKIELSAGSQIKIWERLDGGYADPENVGEYFEGKPISYTGWQLMKLTVTIPAQEGLEVTEIIPQIEGLYPEKSTLIKDNGEFKYTYYFRGNNTYGFDISYTLNGAAGTDHVEYVVDDLVYIPDVTLLGFFIVALDTNEVHGYITKTDLLEGRCYRQDGSYDTDKFLGPGTGGPGYYFPYVKNLEGMQYAQTMTQLELYPGSWYGGKRVFDIESLEPWTRGYYPNLIRFYLTSPYDTDTAVKPEAYTSEMLGQMLTRMPNLIDFSANKTGFHNFEAFAQMNGKLQSISCKQNQITSLQGIEEHTELTNLSLNKNNISDLTPLKNIPTAYQWNFIQNNIADLTPIQNVTVNRIIHFGFQTVLPEPVLAEMDGDTYKLVLPMPVDIDGTRTKIGFARWLDPQIGHIVPAEERTKLLVKYTDADTKLYPILESNGEVYVEIPKADVPNAGTPLAFQDAMMRFWFQNDDGADARTRGNFNGKVDFTATVVQPPVTHQVTYKFVGQDNPLPQAVLEQLPPEQTVTQGETVVIPPDLVLRDVSVADGIWSFAGWDKTSVEDVQGPVVFTGTWKFSRFAASVNEAPTIHAVDRVINQGESFDPMHQVTASDREDDDLTNEILLVDNSVDTAKPGMYRVTYQVTDKDGACTVKTIQVTVNPKQETLNSAPNIIAEDKVLVAGDTFDAIQGVTATDKEDGDLTEYIEVIHSTVDANKVGTYQVTYKVTDRCGASVTKTIKVTVQAAETLPTPTTPQEPTAPGSPENSIVPPTDVPQTGDAMSLTLWCSLFILSVNAIIWISLKKKEYI